MTQEDRAARIEEAAYAVLSEKGFKGASMLAIAKTAGASNETLYKWYGDKIGLFEAMITSNTQSVIEELQAAKDAGKSGLPALRDVGRALLTMVTSQKAIVLNRAAAGDTSGRLGRALAQEGRDRVMPILATLLQDTYGPGQDVSEHLDCFISLLLGDLQIRRATGAIDPPSASFIADRANRAVERLERIYPRPE